MAKDQKGFTLLELIVVFVLVIMAMSFAVPAVRNSLMSDPLWTAATRLCSALREARLEAYQRQHLYSIELDLDQQFYRSPKGEGGLGDEPFRLPEGVTIRDVWIMGVGKSFGGKVIMEFTPRGYTRPTLIRLGFRDGREMTVEVNAFLGASVQEGRRETEGDG